MSIISYIFLFYMFLSTVFSEIKNKNENVSDKFNNQDVTKKVQDIIQGRTNKTTIFETFKNDVELKNCVFLKNDQFMKLMSECRQQYSEKAAKFSKVYYEVVQTYFCMGYYDLALKICYVYNNTINKSNIEESFKKDSMNLTLLSKKYDSKICTNFVNVFYKNVTFPQTQDWSLQKYLDKESCERLCIDNENINSNCLLIYELFTFINNNLNIIISNAQINNTSKQSIQLTTKKPSDLKIKIKYSAISNLNNIIKSKEVMNTASTEKVDIKTDLMNGFETTKNTKISNEETIETNKQAVDKKKYAMSTSTTKFINTQYPDQITYNNGNNNEYSDNDEMDNFQSPGEANSPVGNVGDIINYAGSKQLSERGNDESYVPYFLLLSVSCVIGYFIIVNKHKILALAVEGRPNRLHRRRPNTANYRKLDSNLEEAVTSTCNNSVSHVIY